MSFHFIFWVLSSPFPIPTWLFFPLFLSTASDIFIPVFSQPFLISDTYRQKERERVGRRRIERRLTAKIQGLFIKK